MKKALLIGFVVIIVIAVLYAGFLALQENNNNKVAAECLRGNQTACNYFQARENLAAEKLQLQEAQTALQQAKEAYEASLEATQTGGE